MRKTTARRQRTGARNGDCGEQAFRRAMRRALGMLSYRSRSRREIMEGLNARGFPPQVIEGVVSGLEGKGLLDDYSLACDMVSSGQKANRSRSRIYSDMRRRGIGRETAEEALESTFDPESELRAACEMMRRFLRGGSSPPGEDDIGTAARRLSSRGFSAPTVMHAIGAMRDDTGVREASGFLDTDSRLS